MKLSACCLVLLLTALSASAELETCSDVSECSEGMKAKCAEMSETYKDEGDKEFVLSCKNGLCMCNIQFVQPEVIVNDTCQLKDKEPAEES